MIAAARIERRPPWPFALTGRRDWLAIAPLFPSVLFLVVQAIVGIPAAGQRVPALLSVPALAALALLQARHSIAIARGGPPRYWPFTLLAMMLIVYVPLPWVSNSWALTQWFTVASCLLLLPARLRPLVVLISVAVIFHLDVITWIIDGNDITAGQIAFYAFYLSMVMAVGGLGIALAPYLARTQDELVRTRAELAVRAVQRERLRVSRDLHDLLGHSLSAVSLKGDLAMRLLPHDLDAATEEIHGLTAIAADALRGTSAVTFDEHEVSFRDEVRGALTLLRAAGIDCHLDLEVGELSPEADRVLGWAVREGVTNVLRHSEARRCDLLGTREGPMVRITLRNDGAGTATGERRGLAGLTERVQASGGDVIVAQPGDGTFTLDVRVPRGDQ